MTPGTKVGPYEVVSLLGVGGMGEVYRARDARLGRDVALKILSDSVAADPERIARFQREAQVLAALHHPNISGIHGIEERALVLELVEGETLADRIARGPIPVDDALLIAKQIADGLEAAHDQGVIHRDLKPSNIKITPDGVVKVLDFGLAKLLDSGSGPHASSIDVTASPTITSPALVSGVGTILGTAAYMAPEQAKGRPADKRSDVWAFGCVLFEMLTATRAFEGEDVSDTLAAVLRGEPQWTLLPADLPVAIVTLLRACLTRDRKKRPGDVAAIAFVLDHESELVARSEVAPPADPRSSTNRSRWPAVALGGVAVVIAVAATILAGRAWLPSPPSPAMVRFEVQPPPDQIFPGGNSIPRFAVSLDGRSVAVEAGRPGGGPYQLWIRRLDNVEAQGVGPAIPATDISIQGIFWFADGATIGFFDEPGHKLKKLEVQSGAVQTLADVPGNQYGGTASDDGTVLFSSTATKGIVRVAANGGVPAQVTTLDAARHEVMHLWPRFLPDGRHFLYLAQTPERSEWGVYVASLDSPDRVLVVRTEAMAEFAPPDRLLYVRGESLFADTLDMRSFQPAGRPVLLVQPVFVTPQGRAGVSVSRTGVLVHASGGALATGGGATRTVTWLDRDGREQPVGAPDRSYTYPRISPDGTRLALDIRDGENDIWMLDFARKTLSRLTFGPSLDRFPVWAPDGKRLVFGSGTPVNLYAIAADGTGAPERLTNSANDQTPSSISPDGSRVVFNENTGEAGLDLRTLALDAGHRVQTLLQAPGTQRNGAVSPDGRWIAYESLESGQAEIYVRPFPDVGSGRWQVSSNGGTRPLWSRDGTELYYVSFDTLMAVRLQSRQTWTASSPTKVLSNPAFNAPTGVAGVTYDISPDGKRFLVLKPVTNLQTPTAGLVVVQNWQEALKRVAPAN